MMSFRGYFRWIRESFLRDQWVSYHVRRSSSNTFFLPPIVHFSYCFRSSRSKDLIMSLLYAKAFHDCAVFKALEYVHHYFPQSPLSLLTILSFSHKELRNILLYFMNTYVLALFSLCFTKIIPLLYGGMNWRGIRVDKRKPWH